MSGWQSCGLRGAREQRRGKGRGLAGGKFTNTCSGSKRYGENLRLSHHVAMSSVQQLPQSAVVTAMPEVRAAFLSIPAPVSNPVCRIMATYSNLAVPFCMCSFDEALALEQVCKAWRSTRVVALRVLEAMNLLLPGNVTVLRYINSLRSFRRLAHWITQNSAQPTLGLRYLGRLVARGIGESVKSHTNHMFPALAEEMACCALRSLAEEMPMHKEAATALASRMGEWIRCIECSRVSKCNRMTCSIHYLARFALPCGGSISVTERTEFFFSEGLVPMHTSWENWGRQYTFELRFEGNDIQGIIFSTDFYVPSGKIFSTDPNLTAGNNGFCSIDPLKPPLFDDKILHSFVEAIGIRGCSDMVALYLIWSFLYAPRRWEDNGFARHTLCSRATLTLEKRGASLAIYGCELFLNFAEPMRFRLLMETLGAAEKGELAGNGIGKHIDEKRADLLLQGAWRGLQWKRKVGMNTRNFDASDYECLDALSPEHPLAFFMGIRKKRKTLRVTLFVDFEGPKLADDSKGYQLRAKTPISRVKDIWCATHEINEEDVMYYYEGMALEADATPGSLGIGAEGILRVRALHSRAAGTRRHAY